MAKTKSTKERTYTYFRSTFTFDGKRYDVRGKTQKEADQRAALKLAALERGEDRIDENMTVKAWSESWIKTCVRPKVRKPGQPKQKDTMTEKSFEMYQQKLSKYILPCIGNLKLKEVTPPHLRQMMLNISADGSAPSKSTANKVRIITRAMFEQAVSDGLILREKNPAKDLKLPYTEEGHRRALTAEELDYFYQAAELHPCGLWFRLLLETGIRPGEGMALTVGDFDFNAGLLTINKAKESGSNVVSMPKTEAGIRTVFIPAELTLPLQAAFSGRSPDALAFPQRDGHTMKTDTSALNDWRSFFKAMQVLAGAVTVYKGQERTIGTFGYSRTMAGSIKTEKAGYEADGYALDPDITVYYLRHTFCTALQKAGADLYTAMRLMGHKDISTTAKIYTHSDTSTVLNAAALMQAYREKTAAGVAKGVANIS